MPLLVPIAVSLGGAAVAGGLVFGFLRGIRWGLRRRMHRLAAEHAKAETAES